MPFYVPKSFLSGTRGDTSNNSGSGFYIPQSLSGKSDQDSVSRVAKANATQLRNMEQRGETEQYEDYQKGNPILSTLAHAGSGLLDIVNRGAYASGAYLSATQEGRPVGEAFAAAGREFASGIGDIKGEKKMVSQVLPNYSKWAEEHPFKSFLPSLAIDIATDPGTLVGAPIGRAIFGGIKAGGKVATKAARATALGDKAYDTVMRSFSSQYLAKESGRKLATIRPDLNLTPEQGEEIGKRIYEIYEMGKWRSGGQKASYKKVIEPIAQITEKMSPQEAKDFIRQARDGFDATANPIQEVLQKHHQSILTAENAARKAVGLEATPSRKYYLSFDPRNMLDLIGKKPGTSGIFKTNLVQNQSFDRAQKLSGDELVKYLETIGVKDEDMPKALTRMIVGRTNKSVEQVRRLEFEAELEAKFPEMLRKIDPKTKLWHTSIKPGETIWLPAGQKHLLSEKAVARYDRLQSLLDRGTPIGDLVDLAEDAIKGIGKEARVYAVPKEFKEFAEQFVLRTSNPESMYGGWEKTVGVFRNLAILSPFFHSRNGVSILANNYVRDINPLRYYDTAKILNPRTSASTMVNGKSVGKWRDMINEVNLIKGGLAGIGTEAVGFTGKVAKGAEKVFKANRWIGSHMEEYGRSALLVDRIVKGDDLGQAARFVKDTHFDYTELTPFEQGIRNNVIPFYTWIRRNSPFQLRMILTAPNKYANIQKVKDILAGNSAVTDDPEWWSDQDVWRIGENFAYQVGLPYADLNIGSGAGPAGATGPAGGVFNLMTGYDPYRQKQISAFPGQRIPVAGKDIPVLSNPKTRYAIESFLPVAKRYGFDIADDINQYFTGNDEDKKDVLFSSLKRFLGVGLIPKLKNRDERSAVLRMQRELQNYNTWRKQQQELHPEQFPQQ